MIKPIGIQITAATPILLIGVAAVFQIALSLCFKLSIYLPRPVTSL